MKQLNRLAGCSLLLVALAAISGGVMAPRASAQAAAVMRLDPSSATRNYADGAFSFDVVLEGGTDVAAYEFTLRFDPRLIKYVAATDGPFLASTGRNPFCPTVVLDVNSVKFGCATFGKSPIPPSGAGLLATLTFEPVAQGVSELHFIYAALSTILASDTYLPVEARDGNVTIVGGPQPSAATPVPTATAFVPDRQPQTGDLLSSTPAPGAIPVSSGTSPAISEDASSLPPVTSEADGSSRPGSAAGSRTGPVAGSGAMQQTSGAGQWPAATAVLAAIGAAICVTGIVISHRRSPYQ